MDAELTRGDRAAFDSDRVTPATGAARMNIHSSLASATLLAVHTRTTPEPAAAEADTVSRRADLVAAAADKREEIARLQQELEDAKDAAGGTSRIFGWLFGSDGGAGEVFTDKRHERAAAESYGQMTKEAGQAREERDSFQNLFGTIFAGPLIGTHVGTAGDPSAPRPTQLVSGRAESTSWHDALTREP